MLRKLTKCIDIAALQTEYCSRVNTQDIAYLYQQAVSSVLFWWLQDAQVIHERLPRVFCASWRESNRVSDLTHSMKALL